MRLVRIAKLKVAEKLISTVLVAFRIEVPFSSLFSGLWRTTRVLQGDPYSNPDKLKNTKYLEILLILRTIDTN